MPLRHVTLGALLLTACAGGEPVTFSQLRLEEVTATRAVLRFTTSRPTSCEAELGTSPDALNLRFTDPDMRPGELVTQHQVPLENLAAAQTYFVRARAVDASGGVFLSETLSFTTLPSTGATRDNVALRSAGASVTFVSSNWGGGGNDSSYGAHKALDGDFVTEWSTAGDGDGARLDLDLGQVRRISAFGFRSRSMTDGTAIIRRVSLSLDGAAALEFDTPDPAQLYVFELPAPVEVRSASVRALSTTGGNTGAKEIQLLSPAP